MKKTWRILALTLMFLTLLSCLFACASGSDDKGTNSAQPPEMGDFGNDSDIKNEGAVPGERKIIKTVNEQVETTAYNAFITKLGEAAAAQGGYISSSRYTGGGEAEKNTNRRACFVIRIPAENLSAFCNKVGTLGSVTSFSESAEDITLAYVDVDSRIAVLVAEEEALLTMLREAGDTATVLAVRAQLSDVQGELASLRARKRVYDDQVAYSTVNLSLQEVVRVSVTAKESNFFTEAGDAFVGSLFGLGSGLRTFGIFFIGALPFLLFFALIGGVVVLIVRAKRKKTK